MNDPLNSLLREVANRASAARLDGLEAAVLLRIAKARRAARTRVAMAPFQVATLSLSLAVGIAAGVWWAGTVPGSAHHGLLDNMVRLAPSSLLEGRQ
jgi:hypothetical protein